MIDILVPLGKGSRYDNLELRYCLRSIEKHLSGVGNIFIVGERPEWIQNVIHIPGVDIPNNWERAFNIYNKILAGCATYDLYDYVSNFNNYVKIQDGLSDNFLFMNDDHFLLRDYEAESFPYYHRGFINLYNFRLNPPQERQYLNTINHLDSGGILDYDVHCPILYNKRKFKEVFEYLEWQEHGYAIKSMYCDIWIDKESAIECDDLKFSEPLMKETIYTVLKDRDWFSIGDNCLKSGGMKEVLQELYPDKSKYEI